jgi:uncharacterized protein (DUF952 family)
MTRPTTAYKVLTAPQMADLEAGSFEGAPIDIQDGYIHLSTAAQLTETVDKHFADQPSQSGIDRIFAHRTRTSTD